MSYFLSVSAGISYNMTEVIAERIRECLDRLNAGSECIKPGDRVAVKVNIPVPMEPLHAACSHPAIVMAVVGELRRIGARVTVYEDCYSSKAGNISGVSDAARMAGAEFINLNGRPYKDIRLGDNIYKYYEDIYDADHVVEIPKLKTHLLTNYTGAIKNMFGCIIKDQRRMFHRLTDTDAFSEVLVDVYSVRPPILVVMDGILAMEGTGPTHGTPKECGLLLISNDGITLDYYASRMMGYEPTQISTNRIALKRRSGGDNPDTAVILGENPENIHLNLKLLPVLSGHMKERFIKMTRGRLDIANDSCVKCGLCVESCPFEAISMQAYPEIDRARCKLCYCCAELCPNEAIIPRNSFSSNIGGA